MILYFSVVTERSTPRGPVGGIRGGRGLGTLISRRSQDVEVPQTFRLPQHYQALEPKVGHACTCDTLGAFGIGAPEDHIEAKDIDTWVLGLERRGGALQILVLEGSLCSCGLLAPSTR